MREKWIGRSKEREMKDEEMKDEEMKEGRRGVCVVRWVRVCIGRSDWSCFLVKKRQDANNQ